MGSEGSNVWLFPKIKTANQLWLGVNTSTMTSGVFINNQVKLTLKRVTGPGEFALYDVDAPGNPLVWMNTRDGIMVGRRSNAAFGRHLAFQLGVQRAR